MHIRKLTDQKILELAQKYGSQARLWRQRFAGLLPEINRRRLFEKKGCKTIIEFAEKFAGMTEKQVRTVLNLEQKFSDKPVLHQLLIDGEVSANKLVRVAAVATSENEEFWAEKSKILSKSALETLVRDEKILQHLSGAPQTAGQCNFAESEIQDGLFEPENGVKSLPGQTLRNENKLEQLATPAKIIQLNLAKDVTDELLELKQKGININELLREFLKKREEEIEKEENQISESEVSRPSVITQKARRKAEKCEACVDDNSNVKQKPSRYINVATRKFLNKKFGNKCSIQACIKPAEEIHHTQRWALNQNHDPRYLAPLCKEHHQIAHSIDQKYLIKRQF